MYRLASTLFVLVFICDITHCDSRKCFGISRGNKTRRFQARNIPYKSYSFSQTMYDFQVPRKASIIWTNGSSIRWKSSTGQTGAKLRNYLLRIERFVDNFGSPIIKEEMFLLGSFKAKKDNEYSYNCVNITDTTWVEFTIWALAEVNTDTELPEFVINDYRIARKKWTLPDPAVQAARARAIACVCKGEVMVNKVYSMYGNIVIHVAVYNEMYPFQLQFFLNKIGGNGKTVTVKYWSDTTSITKNTTIFERNFQLGPGIYQMKVQKRCGRQEKFGCPREGARDNYIQSYLYKFKNQKLEKASNIDIAQSNQNGTHNISDSGISMEPLTSKIDSAAIAGISIGIVGGVALIYVIYVICLSRQRKPFGLTDVTNDLVGERHQKVTDYVAVIYVNDSPSHTERVDRLCRGLMKHGLNVSKIDELTRREGMFRNWKTEGEHIFKTHESFIFVLSPGLVDACRPPGQKQITTGRNLPIANVEATSIGYTNIPRLILDCIKNFKSLHGETSLQTVYFHDKSRFSNEIKRGICDAFVSDHISVMSTKSVSLEVNKNHDILERDISQLIELIKRKRTYNVKVCTSVL